MNNNTNRYEIFLCPACKSKLQFSDVITCKKSEHKFQISNGIPLLYWPTDDSIVNDVTDTVKNFYEEHPFPGYEEIDTAEQLEEKAKRGVFARLLDSQIPQNARVLEVGCGTGQLSNFLAMNGRTVWGADLCVNSLELGYKFSVDQAISAVNFIQMNLFKPVFPDEYFDFVLCNGVLHHTNDPLGGFRSISKLVKPGGYIIVGLYNKIGRVWTNLRRQVFRITKNRYQFLDSRVARNDIEEHKKQIWYTDQYLHPHEVSHTIDEVLSWFDETGYEFVNSIPKTKPFSGFSQFEPQFEPNPRGSSLEHAIVQFMLAINGGAEGGFFIMIGRRKEI